MHMTKFSMEILLPVFSTPCKSVIASLCLIPWCGWARDHPEYYLQSISILIILSQKRSILFCQSPLVKDNLYYAKKWTLEYCFWSIMKWFNNNVSSYFLNDFKTLMHCRCLPPWLNEMGQFKLQPAVWGSPHVQGSMTVLSPFLFILLFFSKYQVIFLKRGMSLIISHIQLVINLHKVKVRYFSELHF